MNKKATTITPPPPSTTTTKVTALNVRGGITEASFADLTPVAVASITPGQSITVEFASPVDEATAAAVVRRIETADAAAEATRAAVEAATFDAAKTQLQRVAALEAAVANLTRLVLGK